MRKIYALAVLLLPFAGFSQQGVQFTQYMFNKIHYNPGVAGSGGAICVNLLHRSQWVGFEGAPTTQNLNVNWPVAAVKGGFFLNVVNDQIGFFQNLDLGLGYAYQMQLSRGTLGLGIGLNLKTKSVNNAAWIPSTNNLADPSLSAKSTDGMSFEPSFGVYYESDNIWAGISTTNLLESQMDLEGTVPSTTITYGNARHYYAMAGYNWDIPATNWTLMPSTLVKMDARSMPSFDVNVTGMYNNKFWGGVTYRLEDAIGVNIGYQLLPSLKIGYSYDVAISAVGNESGGSHEILARYCFKIVIPPPVQGSYKNPRFL